MASKYESDISRILKDMSKQEPLEEDTQPIETLHIYPVEGGILILREDEIVDSDPPEPNEPTTQLPTVGWFEWNMFTMFMLTLCLFLCFDSLSFFLPSFLAPMATIAIIPDQQNIMLKTTLSLVSERPGAGQIQGRLLPTLTLSQRKTEQTTGKGHQNASYAFGSITFYNGLLTAQTIPAGTQLTDSDGIVVVTTQDALIPAANPPTEGQVTVSAHALQIGSQGDIRAKNINKACCGAAVLAVNFAAFQGGQDARDFTYVTKQDIQNAAVTLEKTVSQSLQSAFASQLSGEESLVPPRCKPTTTSDHQAGDESKAVTVTVSASCSALVYNTRAVQDQATQGSYPSRKTIVGKHLYIPG